MALIPGTKLGPYEIQWPLGAGGMGEVYRARDTRLERTVAIKILPPQLAVTPEARQRFEREAKSISALNHPHICVLHDIGSQNGTDFLVMECLEGETLASRLAKGPLPLEPALKIGIEIADALEKAHRSGICHRDLKPANVMLTKTGAKLMDFGLAKPAGTGALQGTAPLLSAAVTVSSPSPHVSPITTAGTIVGTIQYMSPEQLQGKEADARSDIFAFGAMLYEMVTGKRAFDGRSQISVASAVLEKDPEPVRAFQPAAPPTLDRTIRTCLAKDPEERFQTAHDLKLELQWMQEALAAKLSEAPAQPKSALRQKLIWLGVAFVAVAAAALVGYWLAPRQNAPLLRAFIETPADVTVDSTGDYSGPPVLSPQGDSIVFCAHSRTSPKALWVRPLNSFSAQRLEGTEGAYDPFWSPDGKFIAFFAKGKLNRIPIGGGAITALADASNGRGGSWGTDGVILFAPDIQGPIYAVPAKGGKASLATTLDASKHDTHRWPSFLPDGKHFLYLATNHGGGKPEVNGIYLGSLDGRETRMLVVSQAGAQYASGFLLFASGGALMAQPFDPAAGKLTGEAATVVGGVLYDGGVWRSVFSTSQNNELVYEPGSAETSGDQLVWFDRSGKQLGYASDQGPYMDPRLSPDGHHLAVSLGDPQREIWVLDLDRGNRTRLTFSREDSGVYYQPAWSPDGKTIVFTRGVSIAPGGNRSDLIARSASGSGLEKVVMNSAISGHASTAGTMHAFGGWSPDGKYFTYVMGDGPQGHALFAKPLDGNGQPFQVAAPASDQANISYYRISPNGRWVAYTSDESGRTEVYIAPFPRGEGKWQVSTNGADFPAWRADGKEVFFQTNADEFTACSVSETRNELQIGAPQVLFTESTAALGNIWDVSADGKRFLVNMPSNQAPAPLHLIANWTTDLKKQ